MSTDHFVFVPKIFMVVSLLLLPFDVELSVSARVCVYMGNEVFAWLFPFALLCQQPFSMALLSASESENDVERVVGMIKCAFKVSPKYGCLCPKPIRMKSAKFVFVHKCVELYILYLYEACHHTLLLSLSLYLPHTHIMYSTKKTQPFAVLSALHRREWLRLFCVTHSIYCAVGRFSWHDTLSRTKYTK